MGWAIIAAVSAAAWLSMTCSGAAMPEVPGSGQDAADGGALTGRVFVPLMLGLLMVSLQGGASITGSLHSVGEAVGGLFGEGLCKVCDALHAGSDWDEAWLAYDFADQHDAALMIRDVLAPSWRQGVPPCDRLSAALHQWDADARGRIEREAATLSVRLLLPTGLCFLPAFVFLGVIPAVAAFATGG